MKLLKQIGMTALVLAVAAGIWLPSVHWFFAPRLSDYVVDTGLAPRARAMLNRQLDLWTQPEQRATELQRMRASNAEWDFMGRTFLVLALANAGLREPAAQSQYLAVMDTIIEETLRLEKEKTFYYFLMGYGRAGEFVAKPARSVFVDGEIAMMLAARRLVQEKAEYGPLLLERIDAVTRQMQAEPVLCGESYPDECWMFCNTVALAAMRMADVLEGTDHSAFCRQWVAMAKEKLVHAPTGLLVSSFSLRGDVMDGPEGSSIWMVAHCLQLVDAEFAADQYRRAKKELARQWLGFGWAREWPASWHGPMDIDSGPIVPVVEASAGSSGQAPLAARAFGDEEYLRTLLTSLSFAGFPRERGGRLRYCAGNQVGDAVLFYALVEGPLWEKVRAQVKP